MLEGDVVVLALVTCITCSLKLAPVVAFLDALMVAAMGQVAGPDALFDNVSEEQICAAVLVPRVPNSLLSMRPHTPTTSYV
jgi:hypothetical protein